MTAHQKLTETGWKNLLDEMPHLPNYQLTEVLGEGRFGIVYKARQLSTGQWVAIKFLKIWSVPDHAQENLVKRFELEYETGLIQSPYLIQTIELSHLAQMPYFVMEFCKSGNLERKIHHKLPLNEALALATKILLGLKDLHSNGKIHRDLKPENILFDQHGNPKLTDFGISGHINIQLTIVNNDDKPEQVFGSYAYMAPEQIAPTKRKNTLLPTIDIFSFGVVCFEMLTGCKPFGRWETHDDIEPYLSRSMRGQFDDIRQYNSQVPELWVTIISKCLEHDRTKRFQNVEEILELLKIGQKPISKPCHQSFKLKVLDGEEYGKVISVNVTNTIRLGRQSSTYHNDIALTETISNYISRRHLTFENIATKIYVRDGQWDATKKHWVSSKNGTWINGKSVSMAHGQPLFYDDIITVGNTSIKII